MKLVQCNRFNAMADGDEDLDEAVANSLNEMEGIWEAMDERGLREAIQRTKQFEAESLTVQHHLQMLKEERMQLERNIEELNVTCRLAAEGGKCNCSETADKIAAQLLVVQKHRHRIEDLQAWFERKACKLHGCKNDEDDRKKVSLGKRKDAM